MNDLFDEVLVEDIPFSHKVVDLLEVGFLGSLAVLDRLNRLHQLANYHFLLLAERRALLRQ